MPVGSDDYKFKSVNLGFEAALAATSITHLNLQLHCGWSSYIAGNLVPVLNVGNDEDDIFASFASILILFKLSIMIQSFLY